ncbi:hypothetical protein RND81_12G193800 [Saponaria officinalis]|uniref:Uncharacterized protein n=1 Tax=Saponaria officinalis TaxID=3572 RepID=A0AAW1HCP8_SAPOF
MGAVLVLATTLSLEWYASSSPLSYDPCLVSIIGTACRLNLYLNAYLWQKYEFV